MEANMVASSSRNTSPWQLATLEKGETFSTEALTKLQGRDEVSLGSRAHP